MKNLLKTTRRELAAVIGNTKAKLFVRPRSHTHSTTFGGVFARGTTVEWTTRTLQEWYRSHDQLHTTCVASIRGIGEKTIKALQAHFFLNPDACTYHEDCIYNEELAVACKSSRVKARNRELALAKLKTSRTRKK